MSDVTSAIIAGYLKQLRLPALAQHLPNVAREAEEDGRSYLEFLQALLEAEVTGRRENQARRLLSQAKFPLHKGLDSFHFDAVPSLDRQKVLNLARGEFVDHRRNAILIGNSGTGKTHLAMGIGQELCRRGYRVRFYTAAGLVNELLAAHENHELPKLEKRWLKYDLVICDELGYLPFSKTGAELLFHFFSARYERGSFLVTTNLEFARWTEVFGDAHMTGALIDRLTHKAHILVMNGDSYRFRESVGDAKAGH